MPQKEVSSEKRKRQYNHVKESEGNGGRNESVARLVVAANLDKMRRNKGELKNG